MHGPETHDGASAFQRTGEFDLPTPQTVLARSCIFAREASGFKALFACVPDEKPAPAVGIFALVSSVVVNLFHKLSILDLGTKVAGNIPGDVFQKLPTNGSTILDVKQFSISSEDYLASLTEDRLLLYKWTDSVQPVLM